MKRIIDENEKGRGKKEIKVTSLFLLFHRAPVCEGVMIRTFLSTLGSPGKLLLAAGRNFPIINDNSVKLLWGATIFVTAQIQFRF
jgi:hypothetical protein